MQVEVSAFTRPDAAVMGSHDARRNQHHRRHSIVRSSAIRSLPSGKPGSSWSRVTDAGRTLVPKHMWPA